MKRTICFSIRDALNGNKLVGGMLHADSLDEAAIIVMRREKLTIQTIERTVHIERNFLNRKGRKVYMHLSVSPEYILALQKQSAQVKP